MRASPWLPWMSALKEALWWCAVWACSLGVSPWWWRSSELAWEAAPRERWRGREGKAAASRIRTARYAARSAWSELTGRARTAADDAEGTHLHARFCRTGPRPTTSPPANLFHGVGKGAVSADADAAAATLTLPLTSLLCVGCRLQ